MLYARRPKTKASLISTSGLNFTTSDILHLNIENMEHKIGIIMNGVTGRMGTNQHLMRSIVEIIKQGGVKLPDGDTIMPDPVLVGRNQDKLDELSRRSGISKTSTDLDTLLADDHYT